MSHICLDVFIREKTGTGAARNTRRQNMVPGVLYGGEQDPVAVYFKHNEVIKALNSGQFLTNMIELNHQGKHQKVIAKDVQLHPVTEEPVHIDFFRVTTRSVIEMDVPVQFTGEESSPGLKRGGILNVVRYSITVKCPAGAIPDNIEVDISELDIGDSLHISQINLPENVTPSIDDRDFTIATIVSSRVSKQTDGTQDDADESETENADESDE